MEITSTNGPRVTRIFVVEDDPDDVELIWKAFRRLNLECEIRHLHNGAELLSAIQGSGDTDPPELPHLILLDLNMPVLDGRETLAKLKSDDRFLRVPVVVLTSSHTKEDVATAYALGANSVIPKPYTLNDLVDTMGIIQKYWFNLVRLPHST